MLKKVKNPEILDRLFLNKMAYFINNIRLLSGSFCKEDYFVGISIYEIRKATTSIHAHMNILMIKTDQNFEINLEYIIQNVCSFRHGPPIGPFVQRVECVRRNLTP